MTYWDVLAEAVARLEVDDLAAAEAAFAEASRQRERSPGRIFISETVADALNQSWRRLRGRPPAREPAAGRWPAAADSFRRAYRLRGEGIVSRALRLSDFPGEEAPAALLPVLSTALHLLACSQLFPPDPAAAVRILRAAFTAAHRAALPLDPRLVRADLPLAEEDRLWLVRKAGPWLAGLARADPPAPQREPLARAILRLLDPVAFSPGGRFLAERAWLEAELTDQHLAEPLQAIRLYRAFLTAHPEAAERVAEARVRLVELLGNVGAQHLRVPVYDEALAVAGGVGSGSATLGRRLQSARQVIERRLPTDARQPSWATLALTPDRLSVVLWHGREPRDVAFWQPGDDPTALRRFLHPCRGRLLRVHAARSAVWSEVGETLAGQPVQPYLEALLEPLLPAAGMEPRAIATLGLRQAGPWRAGWDRRLGHHLLAPPAAGAETSGPEPALTEALAAGLAWLAALERMQAAGAETIAGLRMLARRGDPAAAFLSLFLDETSAQAGALAASGAAEGWPLPPLEARACPLAGLVGAPAQEPATPGAAQIAPGAVLVHAERPGAALTAWAGAAPWRVVIDAARRLVDVARAAAARGDDLTLVPPRGQVHALAPALAWLEAPRAAAAPGAQPDLLRVFHWLRLVETHNGDLLDFTQLRPRLAGAVPLADRYVREAEALPRAAPGERSAMPEPWAEQYASRARRAAVVAGPPSLVDLTPERLDALWGVAEGGRATWVFLDSARVHWQLLRAAGGEPRVLHVALAARSRRHVSLLTGAAFLREDLAELLADWLAPYGQLQHVGQCDSGARLRLAGRGVAPDARQLPAAAATGQLAHVLALQREGARPVTLLPERERPAEFWRAVAAGSLADRHADGADSGIPVCVEAAELWDEAAPEALLAGARLVVPVLASLVCGDDEAPASETFAAWAEADARRRNRLATERQRCALEVAALLAAPVNSVDIADPRWWRRWTVARDGAAQEWLLGPDQKAARWAPGAEVYDLPADEAVAAGRSRLPRRRRGNESLSVAVAVWMTQKQWLPRADRDGADGASAERPADGEGRVLRIVGAQDRRSCRQWLDRLAQLRERGDAGAWLLAVGTAPPDGAGRLLAAHPTPWPTVWTGSGAASTEDEAVSGAEAGVCPSLPGPIVLWIAPGALADPSLQAVIIANPPLVALAGDLRQWLPEAAQARLHEAAALRFLLERLPRVDLDAVGLSQAWRAWLQERIQSANAERGERTPDDDQACVDQAVAPNVTRLPDPELPCPDCGTNSAWPASHAVCPVCGLDRGIWLGESGAWALRRAALRARLDAAASRGDVSAQDAPFAFQLWLKSDDYSIVINEFSDIMSTFRPRPGGPGLIGALPGGGQGLITSGPGRAGLATGAPQLLGWAPQTPAELEAHAHAAQTADLTLCLQGWELDAQGRPAVRMVVERALALISLLTRVEAPAWTQAWTGLLPAGTVRALVGLPLQEARDALDLAAWLAVCEEGRWPRRDPAPSPAARALVLVLPLVELEYRLLRCAALAPRLLPQWLQGAPGGSLTLCDLATLPAGIEEEELAWFDRFLLACSQRLRATEEVGHGDLFDGFRGREELFWLPPDGLLLATRRLLGCLGTAPAVAARLALEAERFVEAARDLLAGARREGERTLLSLPGRPLDPARRRTLEMGCLLGAWRLEGAAAPDELDGPALAWLAESPLTVRARATTLLANLDGERRAWERRLSVTLVGEPVAAPRDERAPQVPSQRPAARMGGAAAQMARRVTEFLSVDGPGMLVLRGPAGSGRLEMLAAGVRAAGEQGPVALSPTLVCPDVAMGARAHLQWRREVDAHCSPALHVATEELAPPRGEVCRGEHGPAWPARETAVLLEAQAIPRELRFAVGQRWRGGRVLATVDPVGDDEPWEHLFLTTPRDDAVIDCVEQRAQARRLWDQTRAFAAAATGRRLRGRSERRARGDVAAHWAASLDECIALLVDEHAAGGLGPQFELVAPSRDDLVYAGRALAARRWLPVFRAELDALLLPGALEFVALIADAAGVEESAGRPSLLAPLLAPEPEAAYRDWLGAARDLANTSLRDLYARAARTWWAAAFLAHPAARARVENLVRDAGAESCARFVGRPLWAAWRVEVANWLPVAPAALRSPLVCLATPESVGAARVATVAYLCLGSEPPARHYRVFSRATDRLLVLYQEVSPLSGAEGAEAD